jgi:AsmA protein
VGEGALTFASDARQSLKGTLAVEDLDLTPYVSTFRLLTGDRDWNRLPINVEMLKRVDVDLRLSAARVTLGKVKLGRTAIASNLRHGTLSVAIGESQAFGGVIKGSLALASAASGGDMKARLQFAGVQLDQCLDLLMGTRRVEGKGDLGFVVEGTGGSIYDLTKALNGTVTLTSSKGAIAGINVEQLLKRLERNPLAARGDFRGGKTPYDLLAVKLKVTDGIARVEDVRLEAATLRLGLAGSASIPARDLDLTGTATLVAGPAGPNPEFELPFVVQGRWDDPLVWPDVQLLIRRSGAAAPLLNAVRNRLQRERARQQAAQEPASATRPAASAPKSPVGQ